MAYTFYLHAESTDYEGAHHKPHPPNWAEFANIVREEDPNRLGEDQTLRGIFKFLNDHSVNYAVRHRSIAAKEKADVYYVATGWREEIRPIVYDAYAIDIFRAADAALFRFQYPNIFRTIGDIIADNFG